MNEGPIYVASIFISDRKAFCAVGKLDSAATAALANTTRPKVSQIGAHIVHIRRHGLEQEKIRSKPLIDEDAGVTDSEILDLKKNEKPPNRLLHACLAWIIANTPGKLEAVSIGCFGPLVSTDFEMKGYGKLSNITSHAGWENADIYSIADKFLKLKKIKAFIWVSTEVDFVALGEFWLRFKEKWEKDPARGQPEFEARMVREIRKSIFVFLKFSRSINGGIAYGGGVWNGRTHPLMSAIKPRRFKIWDEIENKWLWDTYAGCCPIHGDCIEGLIGVEALERRAKKKDFFDIDEGHAVWVLVAHYVAQLCVTTTSQFSPSLIVLGGRIIEEGPDPQFLLRQIRRYFLKEISGDGRLSPDYPEIRRPDEFIQTRKYALSGVYGGLIVAERNLSRSEFRTVWRRSG